ncbi:hypothetical protein [Salipiger sp.]|uniref:hypothetical protein n=1 Tax=Salipiger sp. TaxID=2078585 RepID=UPI003A971CB0
MAAPVFFVLLMPWGRVGSSLVTSALWSAPGVRIENEPTTAIRTRGAAEGATPAEIGARQRAHLDAFLGGQEEGCVAAGLKLSHRSLVAPRDYLAQLSGAGFRGVLMLRRNVLKCAVSQMRALTRTAAAGGEGPWQSPWAVRTVEPKPGPTVIDPDEAIRLAGVFRRSHDRMLRDVAALPGGGAGWSRVEYEDLCADPEGTTRAIFDRLEIPAPKDIALKHRKATSDRLEEDILNYDAFAGAVRAAGLERYLQDARR